MILVKTAADFRHEAWEALRGKWLLAARACLVLALVDLAISILMTFAPAQTRTFLIDGQYVAIPIRGNIYTLVETYPLLALFYLALYGLQPALEIGLMRFFIRLWAGDTPVPSATVFSGFSQFWRALWLYVLMAVKVFLWSLLFVIPGIVAAFRYQLAPYLMAEHPDITASQAISESSRLMEGHKWRLFCLSFSFIGWLLLGALITLGLAYLSPIVAVLISAAYSLFFLTPYLNTALAAFYRDRVPQPSGGPDHAGPTQDDPEDPWHTAQ